MYWCIKKRQMTLFDLPVRVKQEDYSLTLTGPLVSQAALLITLWLHLNLWWHFPSTHPHTPEINNRRTLRISSDVPSLTCCRSSLLSASKCHKASCFRSKPRRSEEQECMSDFLHTGNDAEQRLWVKQDRCWPLILGELRITEQNDHSRDCGKSSSCSPQCFHVIRYVNGRKRRTRWSRNKLF